MFLLRDKSMGLDRRRWPFDVKKEVDPLDSAISTSSPTAASYRDNAIMRIRDLHISESAAQESINNSGRSAQRERRGFLVRRVTRMEDLRRVHPVSLFPTSFFFHSFFYAFLSFPFFFLGNSSCTLYSGINAWRREMGIG